jgi:hypothetical protein
MSGEVQDRPIGETSTEAQVTQRENSQGEPNAAVKRIAVVLRPDLSPGEACNAAAIAIAGLRCDAFSEAVSDLDGSSHVAVHWNVVVLKAKNAGQLSKLMRASTESEVQAVVFAGIGRALSNSFDVYRTEIASHRTEDSHLLAVALYGSDGAVRALTKRFSVLQ